MEWGLCRRKGRKIQTHGGSATGGQGQTLGLHSNKSRTPKFCLKVLASNNAQGVFSRSVARSLALVSPGKSPGAGGAGPLEASGRPPCQGNFQILKASGPGLVPLLPLPLPSQPATTHGAFLAFLCFPFIRNPAITLGSCG